MILKNQTKQPIKNAPFACSVKARLMKVMTTMKTLCVLRYFILFYIGHNISVIIK